MSSEIASKELRGTNNMKNDAGLRFIAKGHSWQIAEQYYASTPEAGLCLGKQFIVDNYAMY